MTELIIQTGKHQGKKIDLAGTDCIIGRHESCKIRIASSDVSKQHCRLKHKASGVHAKDLGSRNGTYVNDTLLDQEMLLKPGDTLRVGPMTFLVAEGKVTPAPTAEVPNSPAAPQPAAEKPASDDLIAAWLSEGGDIERSGEDTTVVVPSAVAPPESESETTLSAQAAGSQTSQKSVRDRAKDIIRRWQKEHGKG